ncbi:hypothetical protein D779_0635 [Imhoffiella purpurea]|uniref:Uncharacterized protein n=1 Tax=Imhoffiella purpurea TaxID=1249627 RepID=W9VG86_9GAMM|nr:hypothetical protein D779_0635 [Imhoffiella purpurea]
MAPIGPLDMRAEHPTPSNGGLASARAIRSCIPFSNERHTPIEYARGRPFI